MSALDPAGPAAAEIAGLWWVMFWGATAILAGVTALALYAACRDPARRKQVSPRLLVIGGGLVFPIAVLAALLLYGIRAGHSLLPLPTDEDVWQVEVTGHRWWWDVVHPDVGEGPRRATNVLYVPVGRPVDVHLRAADVIHGFWVPRLGGKLDAIPGITNVIRLRADKPGIYRGQCAEFCGREHARMSLHVEALDEATLRERLGGLERVQ